MAARRKQALTARFRTQSEYERVKKAAKMSGLSLNAFITRTALAAADTVMKSVTVDTNTEAA